MPDSYGRPLWTSPLLRCEISHAAPNVRNVNEAAAKANPMTYQIPVKAILLRAVAESGVDARPRSIAGRRVPGAGRRIARCSRHSRPTVWRRPSPFAILPCRPEPAERRASRHPAAEAHHREAAGRARVEHPDDGRFRVEVRLQRGRRLGLARDQEVADSEV